MTVLLLLLGVGFVGATAWLLSHAAGLPRLRMEAHVRAIEQYGFHSDVVEDDYAGLFKEPSKGPVNEFAEAAGRLTSRILPGLPRLEQSDLTAAGYYSMTPDAIHGSRALLAVFLPLLVVIAGLSFDLITIIILLAAPVIGWELPGVAIRARGRSRLDAIDRELPRLIDVLIATIEAGLGFAASLQMLAHSFKGPLGAELRLAQREQELGIATERALENLQNRCDTPSIRAFARSLIHAQELGVSIGPMLRNLAVDIRRRRRQTAREKIQKLPIKMLFPLMLILPPVFIVILYPAIYNIITSLHAG